MRRKVDLLRRSIDTPDADMTYNQWRCACMNRPVCVLIFTGCSSDRSDHDNWRQRDLLAGPDDVITPRRQQPLVGGGHRRRDVAGVRREQSRRATLHRVRRRAAARHRRLRWPDGHHQSADAEQAADGQQATRTPTALLHHGKVNEPLRREADRRRADAAVRRIGAGVTR